MIELKDKRGLLIAYVDAGKITLPGEPLPAWEIYPLSLELPGWDAQLKLFTLTGQRDGNPLPENREKLRDSLRHFLRLRHPEILGEIKERQDVDIDHAERVADSWAGDVWQG